jgi:hypothetical protein
VALHILGLEKAREETVSQGKVCRARALGRIMNLSLQENRKLLKDLKEV